MNPGYQGHVTYRALLTPEVIAGWMRHRSPFLIFFLYIFLFELFWVFLTSWTIKADCAFLLHGQREAHTGLRQLQSSSRIRTVVHQEWGKRTQGIAQTTLASMQILLALWYHRAHCSCGLVVAGNLCLTLSKEWHSRRAETPVASSGGWVGAQGSQHIAAPSSEACRLVYTEALRNVNLN